MKLKTIKPLFHTAFALCMLAGMSIPAAAESMSAREAGSSHLLSIPVTFNKTINARTAGIQPYTEKVSVEKYQTGTLIAHDLTGTATVVFDGRQIHVKSGCLAITDEQKAALAKEQEREIEERKRVAEAQKKVEEARVQSEQTAAQNNFAAEDEVEEIEISVDQPYTWTGSVLTPAAGVNAGPSGKETYYNLPMDGVVSIMRSMGNQDPYWVREDGVKMLGDYVMVAAHLQTRPRGSLIPTSLGMGIVCDTGTFAMNNHTQLDIAVAW